MKVNFRKWNTLFAFKIQGGVDKSAKDLIKRGYEVQTLNLKLRYRKC